MSAIPPNWMGSVIGAHGAQKSAADQKKTEAADQAERSGSAKFSENLQNVIENSDADGEVYAESEGLGSEGRPFSEDSEQSQEQQPPEEPDSDSSPGGLDVQA